MMSRPKRVRLSVLIGWLFVLALPLLYFQRKGGAEVGYSTFIERLEAGDVERVTFYGDRALRGIWRDTTAETSEAGSSIRKADPAARRFRTLLPVGATERITERLEAQNVEILVRESGGLLRFFLNFGPILLLIVFWIWVFRRVSGSTPSQPGSCT